MLYMNQKLKILLMLFVFLCFMPEGNALNIHNFRPNIFDDGIINTFGSTGVEKGKLSSGLFYDYASNLLKYENVGISPNDSIAKSLHSIDFLFTYGFTDWFSFQLNMPFHIFSVVNNITTGEINERDTGLGELNLSFLFNLRKNMLDGKRRWGFAVLPFLTAHTGKLSNYTSEDGVTTGIKLIADRWITPRDYLSFNLGFRIRPKESMNTLSVNDDFLYAAGYQRLLFKKLELSLFSEIFGSTTFANFAKDGKSSPIELEVGVKKAWASEGVSLIAGFGRGIHRGYGTPDIRFFAALTLKSPVVEEEPAIISMPEKIPVETIINTTRLSLRVKNERGNALLADIQVLDESGQVVRQQKNESEFVFDLVPGKYRFNVSASGYKTKRAEILIGKEEISRQISLAPSFVKVTDTKIEVNQVIFFDLGKATIKSRSKPILDEIVDTLRENPQIKHVRIEGHSDTTGSKNFNIWLSSERAQSVVDYLIQNGVSAKRLSSRGYGPELPIASNATKEGRAKNRRVEFVIVNK